MVLERLNKTIKIRVVGTQKCRFTSRKGTRVTAEAASSVNITLKLR
jgi:hypothetical protein